MANIEKLRDNLERHGFKTSCFDTAEAACDYLNNVLDGSVIGFGGSVTVQQMGLYDRLKTHNTCLWHWDAASGVSPAQATAAPVYICSVNGVAETGEILNIDGKVEAFCNARDLFKDYGIVKYYDVFAHLVQKCGRKKLIETEAKFLRDVFLKEFNANILSYTAWNFDGVKVKYDLEKETEENV